MKAGGKGKAPDSRVRPLRALREAADAIRAARAREAKAGGPLDLGIDRSSMIRAVQLAGSAGQALDFLVEDLEKLVPQAKAEEEGRLLGHVYGAVLRTRKEVRAIHGALQTAEEAHDPPTEEDRS